MVDEQMLVDAIHNATVELDAAREVVRGLANDLADVADVVGPVLDDYSKNLRSRRMALVDECRLISVAIRQVHDAAMAPTMMAALERVERLVKACGELERFRRDGALDAYLKAFGAGAQMGGL